MPPISQTISEILADTYGKSATTRSMTVDLTQKIADYDPILESEETREHMIMLTVWNWFSGGDTAAYVARRIEESLTVQEDG